MEITRDGIYKELTLVFHEIFEDESIILDDATTADDIEEWDSLMQIRILISLEKRFKLRFNPIEIAELENVGQMVDLMIKLFSN